LGAKENVAVVEELQRATRARDWDRYGELIHDSITYKLAGVPLAMGGTIQGKEAMITAARRNAEAGGSFSVREVFGDDTKVCLTGRVSSPRYAGNQTLRGAEASYSTYECIVYTLDNGKITSATSYTNWLDVYTQVGLVSPGSLAG
jgi:ketosteroid isomerase-like protein